MIEINLLHGLDEIHSEYNFFGVDHQFDYHYWAKSKYQQVFNHTDLVPSRIHQYRLTDYHPVPIIAVLYWPSTQLHHLVLAQLGQLDLV